MEENSGDEILSSWCVYVFFILKATSDILSDSPKCETVPQPRFSCDVDKECHYRVTDRPAATYG